MDSQNRNIVYSCYRGSRSMGLETESSDHDVFEVWIPTTSQLIGLDTHKPSRHIKSDDTDIHSITLARLVDSIVRGRITDVEPLFCMPDDITHNVMHSLFKQRKKAVSAKLLKPMVGMSTSQFAQAFNGNKNRFRHDLGYDPKAACHAIRCLWQAYMLKTTSQVHLYVSDPEVKELLMDVKLGKLPRTYVENIYSSREKKYWEAPFDSNLPDEVDKEFWNDYLMATYRHYILQDELKT